MGFDDDKPVPSGTDSQRKKKAEEKTNPSTAGPVIDRLIGPIYYVHRHGNSPGENSQRVHGLDCHLGRSRTALSNFSERRCISPPSWQHFTPPPSENSWTSQGIQFQPLVPGYNNGLLRSLCLPDGPNACGHFTASVTPGCLPEQPIMTPTYFVLPHNGVETLRIRVFH